MGLLDGLIGNGWDDPKSMATLQLAAGLLGPGTFGQGLGRGLQGYQGAMASDADLKVKKAQLEDIAAQAKQRQLAAETQQRLQAFIASKFGAQAPTSPAPMSTSVMFSPEKNAERQGQMQTPMGGSPQGQSPAFPLSFNDTVQLHTMGGPDLLPAWKVATEGLEQKPGSFYIGPDGIKRYNADPTKGVTMNAAGQVVPMAGAADTQALLASAVAEAQEKAKAKYDLVPSYDPDTRQPITVPRTRALGMDTPPAAAPRPLARPGTVPPIDSDGVGIYQRELAAADAAAAAGDPRAAADAAAIRKEMRGKNIPERPAGNPTGPGQVEKNNTALDEKMIGQMATDIQSSAASAKSAQGTVRIANQMTEALNSGKVMAGPGAAFRMFGNQVGNVMGIAGDDKLTETRTAIQSMAKLALEARGSMKGQGQISDYEGKLLQRASAGDIDSMTVPELKVVAAAANKIGQLNIAQHDEVMKRAKANDWRSFYSEQGTPVSNAAKTVVRTGMMGGRKVVQYSDGSTAYAD